MANEIIRPSALPVRTNPVPSEVVPSDNQVSVAGVSWEDGVNSAVPPASQAEAEAGVINSKRMTPLTTKQAIDAQVPPKIAAAINGLNLGTMSQETAADYTPTSGLAAVALSNEYGDLSNLPTLGTAAATDAADYATAAQGALADTAVQPVDLANVATSGDYEDLQNKPTLGTAAAANIGEAVSDVAAGNRGLPSGGGTGEVLVKNSESDYDAEWREVASATAVSYAPQTLDPSEQAQARQNLGATAVGSDLFTAADQTAARNAIGVGAGRTLLRITTFTADGTWTPHPDATLVGMLCVGGGGGGGGSSGAGSGVGAGSGGGGGGMQERLLSAGWGTSQPVTVGAGGTAGSGSGSGSSGGTGGTSSIGSLCVATGGEGGTASSTRAAVDSRGTGPAADGGTGTGTGGTAAGLDVIIPGFPGQIGSIFGAGSTATSGAGGASAMGVGGKQATEGNNGFSGRGYGGGGSGGVANDATGRSGGNGASGVVIITEWS